MRTEYRHNQFTALYKSKKITKDQFEYLSGIIVKVYDNAFEKCKKYNKARATNTLRDLSSIRTEEKQFSNFKHLDIEIYYDFCYFTKVLILNKLANWPKTKKPIFSNLIINNIYLDPYKKATNDMWQGFNWIKIKYELRESLDELDYTRICQNAKIKAETIVNIVLNYADYLKINLGIPSITTFYNVIKKYNYTIHDGYLEKIVSGDLALEKQIITWLTLSQILQNYDIALVSKLDSNQKMTISFKNIKSVDVYHTIIVLFKSLYSKGIFYFPYTENEKFIIRYYPNQIKVCGKLDLVNFLKKLSRGEETFNTLKLMLQK